MKLQEEATYENSLYATDDKTEQLQILELLEG